MHGDFTGRGDDVGPECKEEFYNTVKEKGIPEENILNFFDNGNGIILFLTIPFTWFVRNMRKQTNLFKISSSTRDIFKNHYKKIRKNERNIGNAGEC